MSGALVYNTTHVFVVRDATIYYPIKMRHVCYMTCFYFFFFLLFIHLVDLMVIRKNISRFVQKKKKSLDQVNKISKIFESLVNLQKNPKL